MRIVTLEENFTIPSLVGKIDPLARRGFPPGFGAPLEKAFGRPRQRASRRHGRSRCQLQVLSLAGPGADLLDGAAGVALARELNDGLAAALREHPHRFAGFAHLPMANPIAAADELERAVRELGFCGALVNGLTGDCFSG